MKYHLLTDRICYFSYILPVFVKERKFAMGKITKETLVGELIQFDEVDRLIPVLVESGMHCFGCPASQMESLEEAALVHGIDADKLVEDLNAVLA